MVADTLAWLKKWEGASFVNYFLNYFILLCKLRSDECVNNFQRMLKTCEDTGMPVEAEKSEAPLTKLLYYTSYQNSKSESDDNQMDGKSLHEKGPFVTYSLASPHKQGDKTWVIIRM